MTIGRTMLGPDTRDPLPGASAGLVGEAAQDGKLVVSDRVAVDALLAEFLQAKESGAASAEVVLFVGLLREFLTGGKRLRPLLCYCGWRAVGGHGDIAPVTHVAAALELFHAFALIHDDVMDDSRTRRGRPTVHRQIAAWHPEHPDADRLGINSAILLGDLTLGWSYDLLQLARLSGDRMAAVWSLLDTMRTETMAGQYLDLLATGGPGADPELSLAICRGKTARYTIERPLQAGALLAGGGHDVLEACTAYGIPLGEAFQLRDDLLGVFGSPEDTGKSVLEDLRQAKPTVLLAIARQRAGTRQRERLGVLVGDPTLDECGADECRAILTETGARATVEEMIDGRRQKALSVLASGLFNEAGIPLLRSLAVTATARVN